MGAFFLHHRIRHFRGLQTYEIRKPAAERVREASPTGIVGPIATKRSSWYCTTPQNSVEGTLTGRMWLGFLKIVTVALLRFDVFNLRSCCPVCALAKRCVLGRAYVLHVVAKDLCLALGRRSRNPSVVLTPFRRAFAMAHDSISIRLYYSRTIAPLSTLEKTGAAPESAFTAVLVSSYVPWTLSLCLVLQFRFSL